MSPSPEPSTRSRPRRLRRCEVESIRPTSDPGDVGGRVWRPIAASGCDCPRREKFGGLQSCDQTQTPPVFLGHAVKSAEWPGDRTRGTGPANHGRPAIGGWSRPRISRSSRCRPIDRPVPRVDFGASIANGVANEPRFDRPNTGTLRSSRRQSPMEIWRRVSPGLGPDRNLIGPMVRHRVVATAWGQTRWK